MVFCYPVFFIGVLYILVWLHITQFKMASG